MSSLALATAAHVGGPAGAGFGFGFLFLLIPLFWFGLFFLIVFFATRRFRRGFVGGPGGFGPGHYGPFNSGARSAEATLAERFAQGDIDETEYRARLEVLRANNGPQQPLK